jgi:hypothetical protein
LKLLKQRINQVSYGMKHTTTRHKNLDSSCFTETSLVTKRSIKRKRQLPKALLIFNCESILVKAEAKATLIDDDAKSRVLEAKANIKAEENRIMLTDLATIYDTVQRAWIEKKQNMTPARDD